MTKNVTLCIAAEFINECGLKLKSLPDGGLTAQDRTENRLLVVLATVKQRKPSADEVNDARESLLAEDSRYAKTMSIFPVLVAWDAQALAYVREFETDITQVSHVM